MVRAKGKIIVALQMSLLSLSIFCCGLAKAADNAVLELDNYVHDCARLKPKRMQSVIQATAPANSKPVKSEDDLWRKLFYLRYTDSAKTARAFALKSVKEHPTWAVPHLYLSNENYLDMNDEEALEEVDKALALRPNFINALMLRSELYRKFGKERLAIADADRACAKGSKLNKVIMYELKSKALFALKDYTACIQVCRQSLATYPNQGAIAETIIQCYLKMSNYKMALEECDNRLKLDPGSNFCHYTKGLALHKLGRDRESLRELSGVISRCGYHRIEGYVKDALVTRAEVYDKLNMKTLGDADRKLLSNDSKSFYKDTVFLRHD